MRIIIPIKQVPETKSVTMDEETGTVKREGVESIVNPLDLYAIEIAIQLKERYGGETVAVTMGPPKAIEAVKEAISMGIDSGIMLSDRKFGGSDTWATSYVIAEAIKKMGDFDLIICGERATDGDTGQVGPGVGSFLNLPVASYINHVDSIDDGQCRVGRLVEEGTERLSVTLPALLTVVKEVSEPRLPTLSGKRKAKTTDIPVWGANDLDIDLSQIGLKGSPTRVVKIFRPKVVRECEKLMATDEESTRTAMDGLESFLNKRELA